MADSDLTVKFRGNLSALNESIAEAKARMDEFSASLASGAAAPNASFDALNSKLVSMTSAIAANTAAAKDNRTSWADLALGYVAGATALEIFHAELNRVGPSFSAQAGYVISFGGLLKTAWTEELHLAGAAATAFASVIVSSASTIAAYGVHVLGLSADLKFLGTTILDQAAASIVGAGAMTKFDAAVRAGGFENATQAIKTFTYQLTLIPGMTNEAAARIEGMLGSIPKFTEDANKTLIKFLYSIAKTGDEALATVTKISEAFKGSATGISDLARITAIAASAGDLGKIIGVFTAGMGDAGKSVEFLKAAMAEVTIQQAEQLRLQQEEIDFYDKFGTAGTLIEGILGRDLDAQIGINSAVQNRISLLQTAIDQQERLATLGQGDKIVSGLALPADQVDALQGQLDILEKEKRVLEEMRGTPIFDDVQQKRAHDVELAIAAIHAKLIDAKQAAAGIAGTAPAQLEQIAEKLREIERAKAAIHADQYGIYTDQQIEALDGLNEKLREQLTLRQQINDKIAGGTVYERERLQVTISGNEAARREEMQPSFDAAAAATGIRKEILEAIAAQESKFSSDAISPTGARGVMQVLPSTAAQPGMGVPPLAQADLGDAAKNIMFAAQYLKALADKLGVDINSPSGLAAVLTRYSGADQPKGDKNYVSNVERFLPGGSSALGAEGGSSNLARLEQQKAIDQQILDDATRIGTATVAMQQKVADDDGRILAEKAAKHAAADRLELANAQDLEEKQLALKQAKAKEAAAPAGSKERIEAQEEVARAQSAVDSEVEARQKAADQLELANAKGVAAQKLAIKQAEASHEKALEDHGAGSTQELAAATSLANAKKAIAASETANAAANENSKFQIALREFQEQRLLIQENAQESKISRSQELAELSANQDKIDAATKSHYAKLSLLYKDDEAHLQEVERKKTEIIATENLKRAEVTRQANQQIAQSYKQAADQASQTLGNAVTGMITGQTRLRDAVRSIATQIVQSFVTAGIKMVLSNTGAVGQMVASVISGQAAQTAATTAGVAARTGATEGGALASMASTIGGVLKSIMASAGETFAGIFGFLSPVMGPAAVGPAAAGEATVLSVATGLASFDKGAWSLPSDMIAQVHRGEMIVPAGATPWAQAVMAGAANTPGVSTVHVHHSTNFNVSAMDSRSVQAFFKDHGKTIMRTINESVRTGSHLGLSKLGA